MKTYLIRGMALAILAMSMSAFAVTNPEKGNDAARNNQTENAKAEKKAAKAAKESKQKKNNSNDTTRSDDPTLGIWG